MEVVSRDFADSAAVPYVHVLLGRIGIEMPTTPLNLAFVWALICCGLVWLYLWRSRGGYELRTVGLSPKAAQYAGISPNRVTIEAMLISGGLAGFLGFNEILGNHHQLVLDFVAGAGFTGIAVALMGRNHPFGIILASVLFGALFQGGGELAFDFFDDHPRHGRRHAGPDHPVFRRPRLYEPAAAGEALAALSGTPPAEDGPRRPGLAGRGAGCAGSPRRRKP